MKENNAFDQRDAKIEELNVAGEKQTEERPNKSNAADGLCVHKVNHLKLVDFKVHVH